MENSEKKISQSSPDMQGKSFKKQIIPGADFNGADLRGADFTEAILTNANFTKCKTGLKTSSVVLIFIFVLIISLLSGYIAMLTGVTVQQMLKSGDPKLVASAYIVSCLMIVYILLAIWKGGKNKLETIIVTIVAVLITGLVSYLSGFGSGIASFYASLALILFVLVIIVGTIARASAGTLSSNIIFFIVAIGGGIFSKSLGGGMGTVILSVSCAIISKRVLSGKGDFPFIKKTAMKIGTFFGTKFRNADLTNADFSESTIKNTDFSGAKLAGVKWENSSKKFNLEDA